MSHSSNCRMPGVSTTQPPKSSLISSAVVVVCRPFWLTSLTSRTRSPSPAGSRSAATTCRRRSGRRRPSAGPCSQPRSRSMPWPVVGAGQERRDAELAVEADQRLIVAPGRRGRPCSGRAAARCRPVGAGQVAVDQVRLQVRLDQRHDDDDLIDVGDQDVLPAARGPRQHAVPRLDALDDALGVASTLPEVCSPGATRRGRRW